MNNPLKPGAPESAQEKTETAVTTPKAVTAPLPASAEIGGRKDGTDPTRYGDWEKRGKCVDF